MDAPIHAPAPSPSEAASPAPSEAASAATAAPHGSFAGLAAESGPDPLPRIRATLRDGVLAVSLAGEFDHFSSAPLRGLLAEGAARGARRLVLDTALVTFCDSALLHALDQWARGGGRAELATASRPVRLLLATAARARRPGPGGPQVVPSLPRAGGR
ncbi:STAS domain-containing protein [Streptomyces sp. NPDC048255]|uniref:STAS domain-containing protein n=1 Tax=Streptomyces sp. NPDC048255 TaxID=3154713 RepID=UPI003403CA91